MSRGRGRSPRYEYNPLFQFLIKTHQCIGGAGAGERDDLNVWVQLFGDVTFEQGRGGAAVEVDGLDAGVGVE